jgi:hypothetical protein
MPNQQQETTEDQRRQILVLALSETAYRADCPFLQMVHADARQYLSCALFAGTYSAVPMPYGTARLAALHNLAAVHVCKKPPKGQYQEPGLRQATNGNLAEFACS